MSLDNRVPPPVVAVTTAALMLGIAWLLPGLAVESFPITAAVIGAIGVAVASSGVAQFLLARTTLNPLKPEAVSAFVVRGVYRFTRNPMYLGMAIVLLGWGVYLGNLGAIAALALFVLYINRFQIAPEERALAARFGADFDHYRRRVRRWI